MESRHPSVAVIVAHPDDETLWAGGTLLLHPEWRTTIVTLCRGSDPDRAPRFQRALARYGATGAMGDLDDGPEQTSLPSAEVERTLLTLLGGQRFFRVLTHGPNGEYTRHRRHEETCKAVVSLWASGRLDFGELWMFAYDDGQGRLLPRVSEDSDIRLILPEDIFAAKRDIVTSLYGFVPESWEARATPSVEGFCAFHTARKARDWVALQELDA